MLLRELQRRDGICYLSSFNETGDIDMEDTVAGEDWEGDENGDEENM